MDKSIIKFIKDHHVLTLATSVGEYPYVSNMFYAFDDNKFRFIITSDESTKHIEDILANPNVGIGVVLETKIVGKICGLQATGIISKPVDEEFKSVRLQYIKRFPYAIAMNLELWVIDVNFAKYTDNKLGFGKKLLWNRDK